MAMSASTYSKLRLRLFFHVIMISVLTAGALGGAGYWLDLQQATKPLFLSLGLLLSFVITNIIIFGKIKQWFGQLDQPAQKDQQS